MSISNAASSQKRVCAALDSLTITIMLCQGSLRLKCGCYVYPKRED